MRYLIAALGALACLASHVSVAQELSIYHIDVEQADATLLVSPSGKTLLIDSGKTGHGARIKSLLDTLGIDHIGHFVTTHYHEDHYGGIDDLIADESIPVTHGWDRGDKDFLPASKLAEDSFVDYQAQIGDRATHITRGMQIPLDPEHMSVTCISAGGVVLTEDPPVHGHDENDMSVSLLIRMGDFAYFIGGDIHHATEQKIADLDQVLDVDVYQTNHHGSDTSSAEDFLADMSPTVVIISNGNHGGYKHPRQDTLDDLADLSPAPMVFQTNKYLQSHPEAGNVADAQIADPESVDEDGTILITVPFGGTDFSVSYGSTTRQFAIKPATAPIGSNVVIESLVPDPEGNDRLLESVTLRNNGVGSVSMAGWTLRDLDERVWSLTSMGDLAPGQSAAIVRHGMPMSLNNNGDTIVLLDAGDFEHSRVDYGSVDTDEVVPGH